MLGTIPSTMVKQVTELDMDRLEDLRALAEKICALTIPERSQIHAEKMMQCTKDEYSRAFYESALQLMELLMAGHSLEDGVIMLAGGIPSVESIPYRLYWDDIVEYDKQLLVDYAMKIQEKKIMGLDLKMANRILSKKASIDEWKLYTLRYVDVHARIPRDCRNLWQFFYDSERAVMDCNELKKHISKVKIDGEKFALKSPMHPLWTDVGIWEEASYDNGYGDLFRAADVVPYEIGKMTDSDDANGAGVTALCQHDNISIKQAPILASKYEAEKQKAGNDVSNMQAVMDAGKTQT